MKIKYIVLFLISFSIASCGFKPIYKNYNDEEMYNELIAIKITTANDERDTRKFLYALQNKMNPYNIKSETLYYLNIDLKYNTEMYAIAKDSQATREKIRATVTYTLKDLKGKIINGGNVTNFASFDIDPSNEFANFTSQSYTKDNLINNLSKILQLRISSVLLKNNNSSK
jgi:hypothetical protein